MIVFLVLLGNEENIFDIWVIVKSVNILFEGQMVDQKKRFTCVPQFSPKVVLGTYTAQMTMGEVENVGNKTRNRKWNSN